MDESRMRNGYLHNFKVPPNKYLMITKKKCNYGGKDGQIPPNQVIKVNITSNGTNQHRAPLECLIELPSFL